MLSEYVSYGGQSESQLTPDLEPFVRERAATGVCNNASEVVHEPLRLLKKTNRRAACIEAGTTAISCSWRYADGDFVDVNSGDELDASLPGF